MASKRIRISESGLKSIIRESVEEALRLRKNDKSTFSTDNPDTYWNRVVKDQDNNEKIQRAYFGYGRDAEDLSDLVDKRSRGEEANLKPIFNSMRFPDNGRSKDTYENDDNLDALADKCGWDREEFANDRYLNNAYDENPEGTENIWDDERGYDDESIEDEEETYPISEARMSRIIRESIRKVIRGR